ncbi:glucokinase [Sphingomonas sp. 8AM]|uniref:glucokinase n=1 Tax=Sphingomonas sp. 8AM TaxID=2653170 RepID=UPI0012F23617|nr:glucokinase [Sphingomonas sp. 8AM]VXC92843.1 Glucokinase [Sphingomonas sp. 8AM]
MGSLAEGMHMDAAGIVGHVGRKGLRFALTDRAGEVVPGSMRLYGSEHGSSVSGTLSTFQRDSGLGRLPERSAIAVAGLARGDAISITHTPWYVSRSGLRAMLGQPPLILNDFEAEAWALSDHRHGALLPLGAAPTVALQAPGTYCVIGMTSGLGVSVLVHKPDGSVRVLATEAGHAGFAPASRAMAELVAAIFPNRYPVVAEHVISATGLVAIYNELASTQKLAKRATKPEDITRLANIDPLARQACERLCEAFWTYTSGLVLTLGAWDGVIVTGKLAMALREILALETMATAFHGTGKYMRVLATVPRAVTALDHGELNGAARALGPRFD